MKRPFADAFFFIALINERDKAHAAAKAVVSQYDLEPVTTDFVLLEVADALSAPAHRAKTVALIQELQRSGPETLVRVSRPLLEQAFELYRARPDKSWSLTDCTSFVVMQDMGITEALTGDAHFEQAGFRAVLRVPT